MASIATAGSPTLTITRRSSRRAMVQLGIGMAVILAAIGFLAYQGLQNALVFYITPTELIQKGAADVGVQLQVGAEVRPHSLVWNLGTHVVRFSLCDTKHCVPVVSNVNVTPPAMLRGGGGAVVQGTFTGGVFHASSIMVKHSGNYTAPKKGQPYPQDSNYAHK